METIETIWNHIKIAEAREEAGLTPKDAAAQLDITPFYLSMVEAGKRDPSVKLGMKMGRLYRQPLAHFLQPEKIFALS